MMQRAAVVGRKFISASLFQCTISRHASSKKSLPPHILLTMPALSPTMTSGNIGAWKKQVGDRVSSGDVLVEIETDKAIMDFECQEEGFLAARLVPSGTKEYPVNEPLAILAEEKEHVPAFANVTVEQFKQDSEKRTQGENDGPKAQNELPVQESKPDSRHATQTTKASPAIKKMAAEHGIDLSSVEGTGPDNAITKDDVLNLIQKEETKLNGSTTAQQHPEYKDIPVPQIQRLTGERMQKAKRDIPHFYLTTEVDMSQIMQFKEKQKFTINDFIIKAAAKALEQVPAMNCQYHGTFIRRFRNVAISIAVTTEHGLITPIIPQANELSIRQISHQVRDLIGRAKERRIKPEEYEGGTFTISNLGMYGVKSFSAIINPPQCAILAVGEADKNSIMMATLSCDHRVIDGALGAKWLKQFKNNLEEPLSMLVDGE